MIYRRFCLFSKQKEELFRNSNKSPTDQNKQKRAGKETFQRIDLKMLFSIYLYIITTTTKDSIWFVYSLNFLNSSSAVATASAIVSSPLRSASKRTVRVALSNSSEDFVGEERMCCMTRTTKWKGSLAIDKSHLYFRQSLGQVCCLPLFLNVEVPSDNFVFHNLHFSPFWEFVWTLPPFDRFSLTCQCNHLTCPNTNQTWLTILLALILTARQPQQPQPMWRFPQLMSLQLSPMPLSTIPGNLLRFQLVFLHTWQRRCCELHRSSVLLI